MCIGRLLVAPSQSLKPTLPPSPPRHAVQNVCRSLFEKDKLLFAFHLSSRLAIDEAKMSTDELRFMLTGGVAMGDLPLDNPAPEWISERMWGEVSDCLRACVRAAV